MRRETEEGLRVFREARKGEALDAEEEEEEGDGGGWKVGSKRKRRKGEGEGAGVGLGLGLGLLKGVKRRSSGGTAGKSDKENGRDDKESLRQDEAVEGAEAEWVNEGAPVAAVKTQEAAPPPASVTAASKPKLSLVDYGSDDDSE